MTIAKVNLGKFTLVGLLLALLASAAMLALFLTTTGVSRAESTTWAVEGPITAVTPGMPGTMTANGMTFSVPDDVIIDGTAGPITGDTLDLLEDVNAPSRVRSILPEPFTSVSTAPGASGGTTISTGIILADGTFEAVTVFIELAENVMTGPLQSVEVAMGFLMVNGVKVKVNPDERFPGDILDVGGNVITLADLADPSLIGTLVTVEGYFFDDGTEGIHYAVVVETEAIPAACTVPITRARGRQDRGELRVEGLVAPFAGGPVTVNIFDDDTNDFIGSSPAVAEGADPNRGLFTFRTRDLGTDNVPERVRAEAPGCASGTADVGF